MIRLAPQAVTVLSYDGVGPWTRGTISRNLSKVDKKEAFHGKSAQKGLAMIGDEHARRVIVVISQPEALTPGGEQP
eukprot:2007248-Rhodomonas_salina.1